MHSPIPDASWESELDSRGSKGPRSPLESPQVSLGPRKGLRANQRQWRGTEGAPDAWGLRVSLSARAGAYCSPAKEPTLLKPLPQLTLAVFHKSQPGNLRACLFLSLKHFNRFSVIYFIFGI